MACPSNYAEKRVQIVLQTTKNTQTNIDILLYIRRHFLQDNLIELERYWFNKIGLKIISAIHINFTYKQYLWANAWGFWIDFLISQVHYMKCFCKNLWDVAVFELERHLDHKKRPDNAPCACPMTHPIYHQAEHLLLVLQ